MITFAVLGESVREDANAAYILGSPSLEEEIGLVVAVELAFKTLCHTSKF